MFNCVRFDKYESAIFTGAISSFNLLSQHHQTASRPERDFSSKLFCPRHDMYVRVEVDDKNLEVPIDLLERPDQQVD